MKAYPKYKESGIEWLGKIPEHWEVKKFKFIVKTTKGFAFKSEDFCENGIPVVRASDIKNGTILQSNICLPFEFNIKHPRETLKTSDIIVSTVGSKSEITNSAVGQIAILPSHLDGSLLNQNNVIFRPIKYVKNKYLFFILISNAYRNYLDLIAHGTANQASLSINEMLSYNVPVPTPSEQKSIASYLDRETQKIDLLIAKQERLIALLEEKRQALISHTITKGLDPNVKMKNSGVEWLGEIPEHWEIKKLGHVSRFQNGISKGAEYFGHGFPFINYGDIYKNQSLPVQASGLADSSLSDRIIYSIQEGDIFFTRTSETIEEIGLSSVCLQTMANAIFSGFLIRVRPRRNILNKEYSKYYFRVNFHRFYFVKEMNLVTRASLSQNLLYGLHTLLPPVTEQEAIAKYLDRETQKIDLLKEKAKSAINLLKEKRSALISAAVTGKIDVRESA